MPIGVQRDKMSISTINLNEGLVFGDHDRLVTVDSNCSISHASAIRVAPCPDVPGFIQCREGGYSCGHRHRGEPGALLKFRQFAGVGKRP